MKKTVLRLLLVSLFFLPVAVSTNGYAVAVQPAPVVKPERERSLLPVAEEIGQQIQALVTGEEGGEIEPKETFGTRAFTLLLTFFKVAHEQGSSFVKNFAAWPQVAAWFEKQNSDPRLLDMWKDIGQRLLLVLGVALLAGYLADLLLLPFRRSIRQRIPASYWGRFGTLVAWFFISLMPIVLFLGAALVIFAQSDPPKQVRFFVMTTVYALAILRLVRLVIRFVLAPRTPALRFVPLSDEQAQYMQTWLNVLSLVMVAGYFGVDLARLVRMPNEAITAFNSLTGLLIVLITITVILQKRAFVSAFLRGDLSAAQSGLTLWQSLRLWLARVWHVLAIAYLLIGAVVTVFGAEGSFGILQRGTVLTLLILLAMRMAFYLLSLPFFRRSRGADKATAGLFRPVVRSLLHLAVWAAGIAGIAAAWGADVVALVNAPWGQRVLGSVFSVAATVVVVVLLYELMQMAIERRLSSRDAEGRVVEVSARARTLLPVARNVSFLLLIVIVGLVTLSELGIDITPLLAGAGILGVALGFGSQTLVKDFLTGLFIIVEDTIAIGDNVAIGENAGVVEGMTIRTVRLRDWEGNLHTVPYSEITRVINKAKEFSYAVIKIGVAYDSDLDKALGLMRETGDAMRKEPEFRGLILEPTEVVGVEDLGDYAVMVHCRIKTAPGKQLLIKRAYLLRIKKRFDAEKIEIPFPTTVSVQMRKE